MNAATVDQRRTSPHNLQAEESLLGAMLLARDAIAAAAEVVKPADFYKPAHVHVFDAILALYGSGEAVDPITVADELTRAGTLETVGGYPALVALQANAPAISNAGRYAHIIEELALLRRMISAAGEIAELGYSTPDDVTKAVDSAEAMIFALAEHRHSGSTVTIREALGGALDRLEELGERGESIVGTPTGFLDLDELLSGLQPGLIVIGARPSMGKALALDTPLPTPTGWTTMGGVKVGDLLIDESGAPCAVTAATPVQGDRDCYRVTFDDGSSIVADADHQWFTYDLPAWKSKRGRHIRLAAGPPVTPTLARDQSRRWKHPRVVTTRQMINEGVRATTKDRRPNWYVPLTGALDLPAAALPVDPYVLGCWLGDGKSSGSEMTIGDGDLAHFKAEFEAAGYPLEWRYKLQYATVPAPGIGAWQSYRGPLRVLTRELQAVGLLGGARKHVPAPYLRASVKQRLALLQGLLDTDGTVTNRNGTVELCLANRELLGQARELVCSLGDRPGIIRHKIIRLGDGRECEAWRFCWTPLGDVFRMGRKMAALDAGRTRRVNGRPTRRAVKAIEPVPSVPVRCITVDSPNSLYLAGESMIPTHNTSFALGTAAHAVLAGKPVLFFSLEMSQLEITQRILGSEARVDSTRMRNGKLSDSDWEKLSHVVSRLGDAPLWIDDNPNVTVMEIRSKARKLKAQVGDLGMVVVDYIQLMTGRAGAQNRQVEVAEISRGLKILARELDCPVVALAQLSRGLEQRADKRPMLSDLRESGSLEQDADVVLFLYRDEVYNRESSDQGIAEVIVAKHRSGPTGLVRLAFLSQFARFANMARG